MPKHSDRDSLPFAADPSFLETSATAVLEEAQTAQRPKVAAASPRRGRSPSPATALKGFSAVHHDDASSNRQAELFYLQKQIQQQTPMIFVMEDGARIQGIVEWYDRHSIKVRGKLRILIFKSAIKYLYKAGEVGTAPSE